MPLTTDDLVQIHQLYGTYCHAVDEGDGKAFSACFTTDGVLDAGGPPVKGAEALAGFATSVPTMVQGIRHLVGNIVVNGEGDEAEGGAYLTAYSSSGGSTQVLTTGRYRDRLRRQDGRWLFSERAFSIDS